MVVVAVALVALVAVGALVAVIAVVVVVPVVAMVAVVTVVGVEVVDCLRCRRLAAWFNDKQNNYKHLVKCRLQMPACEVFFQCYKLHNKYIIFNLIGAATAHCGYRTHCMRILIFSCEIS